MTTDDHDRVADNQRITELLDALVKAWGEGDAAAYGSVFAEDASYITFVGTVYQGRTDIVRSHHALFAKLLKGTRLSYEEIDRRYYGPDTAVVTTRGDTIKGKAKPLTKVQTYTLVRCEDGDWQVAAFHNTARQSIKERMSFRLAPETMPAALRRTD
jgi:uncharacterized protein (TIGR02246 family)